MRNTFQLFYKESSIYKIKYESLLATALAYLCESVNNIIIETTRQVTDPENSTNLLNIENPQSDSSKESAFSLYYGRYQNAATKIKASLQHVEDKAEKHNQYVGKSRNTFTLIKILAVIKIPFTTAKKRTLPNARQ